MNQMNLDPNQPPYFADCAPALPPPILLGMQGGKYGISYDIYTRCLEDPLPDGWARHRASVYTEIGRALTIHGYQHAQYSVWQRVAIPYVVWVEMMSLRELHPRGVFASSLRAVQMFRIPDDILIVTHDVALGGMYSPGLIGPTPSQLVVDANVQGRNMPPGWPGNAAQLPRGTRYQGNFASSLNGANWQRP